MIGILLDLIYLNYRKYGRICILHGGSGRIAIINRRTNFGLLRAPEHVRARDAAGAS